MSVRRSGIAARDPCCTARPCSQVPPPGCPFCPRLQTTRLLAPARVAEDRNNCPHPRVLLVVMGKCGHGLQPWEARDCGQCRPWSQPSTSSGLGRGCDGRPRLCSSGRKRWSSSSSSRSLSTLLTPSIPPVTANVCPWFLGGWEAEQGARAGLPGVGDTTGLARLLCRVPPDPLPLLRLESPTPPAPRCTFASRTRGLPSRAAIREHGSGNLRVPVPWRSDGPWRSQCPSGGR